MHEVLTLSLSPSANNLITHFFNAQESYLDYTVSSKKQLINTSIYLKPRLIGNSVNFSPRALIWDYKTGFGALGQFEYAQNSDSSNHDAQVIQTNSKISKNEYQIALDSGLKLPKLNKNSIKYWSDFNRLIYEPKSFNSLKNWDFDPVKYPNGKLYKDYQDDSKIREFKDFEVGVKEWKESNGIEFLEEKYRKSLEETDLLNGLNIVNELDTAWAGFTNELLAELRDDYNPKSEIFNFVIFNGQSNFELSNHELISRIKSFIALRQKSSLMVPLSNKDSNLWYSSAYQNLVFESIQILNSRNSNNISFNQFKNELIYGSNERNIISSINAEINGNPINFTDKFFQTKKKSTNDPLKFSETTIKRPQVKPNDENNRERKLFTETTHYSDLKFPTPDSFPDDIINKNDDLNIKLTIDTQPRALLLEWKTFVSKMLRDSDERSELIDELATLAQEYENEWYHSDDEEYDDE